MVESRWRDRHHYRDGSFPLESGGHDDEGPFRAPPGDNRILMLQPGTKLGDYEIVRTIGQGGMGAVYQARDPQGKCVAIKEMVVDIRDPRERVKAVTQFASEATLLRGLDHPLLVDIYETFHVEDRHYMVMDYVDGMTLSEVLFERAGPASVEEVLDWADQLCDVLHYLHTRDPVVIFRDLKPSNIMLDKDGRIRLIDFGIARVFDDESMTSTFIKGVGSKGFAPIEQYGAGGTDVRTDVYSLGATLYNLLTREMPPASISILAGTDALEPLRKLNPKVPRALECVVLKMMALQKEHRYATVAEVRHRLRAIARGGDDSGHTDDLTVPLSAEAAHPLEARPAAPPGQSRRAPKRWAAYLAALVLICGLSYGMVTTPSPPGVKAAGASVEAAKSPPPADAGGWTALVGPEESWRYFDRGSNLGDSWRRPGFDDTGWAEGPAKLGYGRDGESTVLSWGPDPHQKYITTYFRKTFQIGKPAAVQGKTLRLRLNRDDGAVVYLNGVEVFRSNMPAGAIAFNTPAESVVGEQAEYQFYPANIDSSLLVAGTNLLAAEVHQANGQSTDLGFDLVLESPP